MSKMTDVKRAAGKSNKTIIKETNKLLGAAQVFQVAIDEFHERIDVTGTDIDLGAQLTQIIESINDLEKQLLLI